MKKKTIKSKKRKEVFVSDSLVGIIKGDFSNEQITEMRIKEKYGNK